MDAVQAIILAIVQGVVEFLPISSSAHLILVPELLNWQDQGLAFDVAVHVGTLLAVIAYLRKDILVIVPAWFGGWRTQHWNKDGQLGWMIILATIPLGVVGLAFKGFIELNLRSAAVIGCATLIFGLLLGWADRQGDSHTREIDQLSYRDTLRVGLAQVFALIPGTSRSGVTMTALLAMGYSRRASARFSFLLALPAIALPGLLKTVDLIESQITVAWDMLLLGSTVSAVVAFACISWFISFVQRVGMLPFVIYRVLLSAVIFIVLVF